MPVLTAASKKLSTDRAHPHHRGLQHVEYELRGQNKVTIEECTLTVLAHTIQLKRVALTGGVLLQVTSA